MLGVAKRTLGIRRFLPRSTLSKFRSASASQLVRICELNIDQPFNPCCTAPFSGAQSHDIDAHCPNEGCAKNDNDKAQNKVKNNLCASGTPIQISETSIHKLQAA